MSTETLARTFDLTRGILEKVTPDEYDKPTPCASWDVRTLMNHIAEAANWFPLCVNAGEAPDPDPTHGVDYTAGDFLRAYDEGARASVAAFGAPGAQERMIKLPFGEIPGAAFMATATNDIFVHGWDLAKAIGQPTDLDAAVAAGLLEQMRAMVPDAMRGADGGAFFGPAVEVPSSASAADRLAAFLGRPRQEV